jgi:hypothetical protein
MRSTQTFLQLSAEFGGTKFGPFSGVEIRLGSDPSRNDITLPEGLGVAPAHVKVIIQTDGSFIVAPVERTATVWLYRANAGKPKQMTSPAAVSANDGFSLVTAEGPRFYIITEEPLAQKAVDAPTAMQKATKGINTKGVLDEIKRVGFARAVTTELGGQLYGYWTFLSTGNIFAPRYIVMGMTMASGFIFSGGTSCAALSLYNQATSAKKDLSECQDNLGMNSDGGDDAFSIPSLVTKILADKKWRDTMKDDKIFRDAVIQEIRGVFNSAPDYKWVYTNKDNNSFATFKKDLEGVGLQEPVIRVLAYAAAVPGYTGNEDFTLLSQDSEGKESCGRGPLALTWGQAAHMGMYNIQADAAVLRSVADSTDVGEQSKALRATTSRVSAASSNINESEIRVAGIQGSVDCIYVSGDDERTDSKKIAEAVSRMFNEKTNSLPKENMAYWIQSRLMLYYGADLSRGFEDLKFKSSPAPTVQLNGIKALNDERKKYITNQSANLVARALVIPCLAQLDKEIRKDPPKFIGELPSFPSCAIIKTMVDLEEL